MRWLWRQAIGERWAIALDGTGERPLAARIIPDDALLPGSLHSVVVTSRTDGGAYATLIDDGPTPRALLLRVRRGDAPPPAPGARAVARITRMGWDDGLRRKRPEGVVAHVMAATLAERPAPTLGDLLGTPAEALTELTLRPDLWPAAAWAEAIDVAAGGAFAIAGGAMFVRATPAMSVIDVDGTAPPLPLARAAVTGLGALVRLLDLQGGIVVDLPSVAGRAERAALDAALDAGLAAAGLTGLQRTGINGFGLAQLVRRRTGASLAEQVQADPLAHAVRQLLWRAERAAGGGPGAVLELRAPPAVLAALTPAQLAALARRTGRPARLAIAGSHRLDDLAATPVPA